MHRIALWDMTTMNYPSVIRCKASEAPELYELATLIAMYTNPSCHFDLKDIDMLEQIKILEYYKTEFEKRVG